MRKRYIVARHMTHDVPERAANGREIAEFANTTDLVNGLLHMADQLSEAA